MRLFKIELVVIILLFGMNNLLAQEETKVNSEVKEKKESSSEVKETPTFNLEETVVTATRSPEGTYRISRIVTIVNEDEMTRRRVSSSTSAEFLKDEPGVFIQQTGRRGGAPIIRGMIGKYILPMVDGIRLTDGTIFAGPNSFFNNVDPMTIDHIEIVSGPSSVLYGSDALGGTINMIPRRFDRFPDEFEIHARSVTQWRSISSEITQRLELSGGMKPFNFLLGMTYKNAEDTYGSHDIGDLDNTSWKEADFNLRVGCQLAEGHTIEISHQQTNRFDEFRYDKPYETPHLNEWWEAHKNLFQTATGLRTNMWETPSAKTAITGLEYKGKDLTSFWDETVVKVYWRRENSESLKRSEQPTAFREDTTKSKRDIYGTSLQFTTSLDTKNRIIYGTDLRVDSVPADEVFRDTIDKSTDSVNTVPLIPSAPDARFTDFGLYVLDEIRYLEPVILSIGLRYNFVNLHSEPTPETTPQGFTPDELKLDTNYHSLTWSAGASYEVIEGVNLVANAGAGFKTPSISDVLGTGPFTYGVSVPAVDLDPEKSLTFDLGVKIDFPDVRGGVSGYYTILEDIIDSRPDTFNDKDFIDLNGNGVKDAGEDVYVKKNVGKGYIYGVEGHFEYDFLKLDKLGKFTVFGNIAYTFGQETDSREPMRFIPPLFGSYGIRWENTNYWVEFAGRWAANKPTNRFSTSDLADTAQFPRQPGRLPGYNILSFRFGYKVDILSKATTTFTFSVENLLDKDYQSFGSRLPGDGRSFNLGLEIYY